MLVWWIVNQNQFLAHMMNIQGRELYKRENKWESQNICGSL